MTLQSRFWLLTALRWLPTGLIIPVYALLPLHRGLSVTEFGAVLAVQGFVVLFLELPTGGFADALGRRPLMITASLFALASYTVFAFADTFAWFLAASALSGVFRALDSGPLNAWFVDETKAGEAPDHAVSTGLAGAGTVSAGAIAVGAVAAGGLIAWQPLPLDALALPFFAAAALTLLQLVMTAILMREHRRAHASALWLSVRSVPATIAAGLAVAAGNRTLRLLLGAGALLGFGMVAFEQFTPIRLAELLGDAGRAGAVMGPLTAVTWGVSAAGAAVVPWLLRRWSLRSTAAVLAAVQGAAVLGLGLAWGPIGLIAAFTACYAVHSAYGAVYESLLHGEVGSEHRATVLSLSSMVFQPAGSLGAIVLGAIATGSSTSAAFMVGGAVLLLAVPLLMSMPRTPMKEKREELATN